MKRPKGVRLIVSGRRYYLRLLVCNDRNQMFPFVAPPKESEWLIAGFNRIYDERKKGYILDEDDFTILTECYVPSRLKELNKEGTFYYKADIVSSDNKDCFTIFESKDDKWLK